MSKVKRPVSTSEINRARKAAEKTTGQHFIVSLDMHGWHVLTGDMFDPLARRNMATARQALKHLQAVAAQTPVARL